MSVSLLIDLGTSRLKAVLYDRDSRQIFAQQDIAAPQPNFGSHGEITFDGETHPRMVQDLCEALFRTTGKVADHALLCSKMHGFLLDAPGHGTVYNSWRDERAARSGLLDELKSELGETFRSITGMRLRAGLPFVTLCHMARYDGIPNGSRVLSLAEWVVAKLGSLAPITDESLAAGLGTYDLDHGDWSDTLLARIAREGSSVPSFLAPVPAGRSPLGHLCLSGTEIPVLAAIGDLQAAVYGSGCAPLTALCINIGTGSQVNRIGVKPPNSFVEERAFLNGTRMATISHIPAGRAFRVLENFFEQVATGGGANFWRLAGELTEAEVDGSDIGVDLNYFAGAWRYQDGGRIEHIHEGSFSPRGLVAGAVKALVDQYLDAIALIDPLGETNEIVLAGGMGRRLPAFTQVLAAHAKRRLSLVKESEETLAGLIRIAEGG